MSLEKIQHLTHLKDSRIILAFDEPNLFRINFLKKIKDFVVGIKVGLPVFLTKNIKDKIEILKRDFVFIADLKVADIPYVSEKVALLIKDMGFDFIISHSFIGINTLKTLNKILPTLAVISMSEPSAFLLDNNYEYLFKICIDANVSGLVIGANKHKILKEIRDKTNLLIFSPGIGVQGMPYGSAIKMGADYEIIGRSILMSKDPLKEVKVALDFIRHAKNS